MCGEVPCCGLKFLGVLNMNVSVEEKLRCGGHPVKVQMILDDGKV